MKLPDALPDQTGSDLYMDPVQGRVAHIDADFMCYQVSAETKDELGGLKPRKTLADMKFNAKRGLIHQQKLAGATSYVAHITPSASTKGGRDDFAMTKGYQDNRVGVSKPEHLQAIRAYIGETLPSIVHLEQEADDGMTQANYAARDAGTPELSVIMSRDKDLRMAPGLHWDFDEEVIVDVSDPFGEIWVDRSKSTAKVLGWGTSFFWAQLLMGDTADNIQGLPLDPDGKKVGPIAAYKYLDQCTSDWQCLQVIKYLWSNSPQEFTNYRNARPTNWRTNLFGDMQTLWMRRYPNTDDIHTWLGELQND